MRRPPLCVVFFALLAPCLGKIKITNLSVPASVQNGSDPTVLLDCEYEYDPILDDNLVLKWFLDNNPEQVYQWIPSIGSRTVSEILQPFLDMQYTAPDPHTKYRALRLRNPTVEVGGRYTCYVGSLDSHASESARMIIYAPAKKLELSYNKLSPDTIAVNCEADEVYPEPQLRLKIDFEDSEIIDTDEDNGDSISNSLSEGNGTSLSKSDDNKAKDETSEGGVSKPDTVATDSATVSEDGSQETNENTNSEKSAEVNANAVKDSKKEGKSVGTSESVGPDKSEGTSESLEIEKAPEDDTSEGGVSKPDTVGTNSATVSEDGSQETNENTNSEKSAEGDANAVNKDSKKEGKSVGTSESVGPDKSEGTSESLEIEEPPEDDTSEESREIPSKKVIAVKKGKMYRVRIRSEIKMKQMDKEAEFECILKIPGTEHVQTNKIKYHPEDLSNESNNTEDLSNESNNTEMDSLEEKPETSTLMSQPSKKQTDSATAPAVSGGAVFFLAALSAVLFW